MVHKTTFSWDLIQCYFSGGRYFFDWIRTELLQKQKPLKLFVAVGMGKDVLWKWGKMFT